jgi:hypothetical protein
LVLRLLGRPAKVSVGKGRGEREREMSKSACLLCILPLSLPSPESLSCCFQHFEFIQITVNLQPTNKMPFGFIRFIVVLLVETFKLVS